MGFLYHIHVFAFQPIKNKLKVAPQVLSMQVHWAWGIVGKKYPTLPDWNNMNKSLQVDLNFKSVVEPSQAWYFNY